MNEKEIIEKEIQDLNEQYKKLIQQKQMLSQQLQKVDEELLKKMDIPGLKIVLLYPKVDIYH